MADTGHGASLTLSAETTSYDIVSITIGGQTVEQVDVTNLSSTSKEYIPGDVAETPEGSATVNFDVMAALPVIGSTHLITVTFPLGPDQTTTVKSTFTGTGFITARTYPELVTDTVQQAEISWKMDGQSGTNQPTFTEGA